MYSMDTSLQWKSSAGLCLNEESYAIRYGEKAENTDNVAKMEKNQNRDNSKTEIMEFLVCTCNVINHLDK
ncbi:hypothetical protein POVWA2_010050 [Plasmodium ovale wallikeri]|uniref:Uncharacterized protein n=1 Tax=Plasmodium ovale wallikeri TaxID=864142 RepID=A0A1A8YLS6_PLAOA|nr:hypothetical protein POVWA1_009840 [Plasmodium ovale wallikeri]SBT32522.1 hypothetical protein POVWA2_010050 [Plasmodium ovale wallikeri]